MRIVQALGWYLPDQCGGTELYVRGLARRLAAAGAEIALAAPRAGFAGAAVEQVEGLPVFRYGIPALASRAECRGETPVRGAERFAAWLHAERPDIVHFHTFVTGLGLEEVAAAKAAGARTVVTTHSSSLGWICLRGTMLRHDRELCDGVAEPRKCTACVLDGRLPALLGQGVAALPQTWSRPLGRLPGKAGSLLGIPAQVTANLARQRRFAEVADRFVVLTQWAADALAANGFPREKIVLNRLGHSHADAAAKPGPEVRPTALPVRIGYLGRLDPIKGVLDLAAAFARLPKDAPLTLEFVGPENSSAEQAVAVEMRRRLGDDRRATFAGGIAPEQALAKLAAWDVVCFPARCLEGGPTAAIEAQAVGTPVVGTRIGGLAELVRDGVDGRLVAPGDVPALAAALAELAARPATIDLWRRNLPRARTMDEIAADYTSLYHALRPRQAAAAGVS